MNLIPLTSVRDHSQPKIFDGMVIVNFDHVYCISSHTYWPEANKAVEGSRLYIAEVTGALRDRPYTIDVQETRVAILQLLEGPGNFSRPETQKTKSTQ